MTPVAAANLGALEEKDPALARRLRSIAVEARGISIERSARGHPTVAFATPGGKEYLEDPVDPSGEGKRRAAQVPAEARLVIALGTGLGYHLKALLARKGIEKVILVEPSAAFLVVAASIVDLRRVILDPRVEIIVGGEPDALAREIASRYNHGTEPGRILTLLPPAHLLVHRSAAVEGAWSRRFQDAILEVLRSSERNRRVFEEFVDLWRRNLLANLPCVARSPGFAALEGRFRGVPAVVVGAGPTLDADAPALAGAEDRLLIVATDTALRTLTSAGVRPHLVMSLDATTANVADFDGVETDGSALAMVPVVDPRIPPRFDRRFVGGYGHPWLKFLEGRWGRLGSVLVSGSVATAAYDLVRTFGCSPILLAGVDLAYVGGRSHTRGRASPADVASLGRFRSMEMIARTWFEKSEREVEVPATGGGTVRTTQRMKEWREWFEREVRQGPPTIQTSRGGARIDGAVEMPLAEAVRRFAARRIDADRRLRVPAPRRDLSSLAADLRRIAAEARAAAAAPADADPFEGRPALAALLDWEHATWGVEGLRKGLGTIADEVDRAAAEIG